MIRCEFPVGRWWKKGREVNTEGEEKRSEYRRGREEKRREKENGRLVE